MVTWGNKVHVLSDKASPRYMSPVGKPQRKSSSSTPISSAKPLPDPEAIERYTSNLPSARQAKVDSKAKTAALLGPSRSREKERTPKSKTASTVSRSTSRASSLSMHSAAMDNQEDVVDDTVMDNKDVQMVSVGDSMASHGTASMAEQLQRVMEKLEEANRRANEADERAHKRELELETMRIENSNQGLKYLKEMESLRKSHQEEFSRLQSRKEASADLATKRYMDLMRERFGISRKDWREATKEWEKKMDAKSENEDSTSSSSDKETGNSRDKKGGDGFGECGSMSYPSMLGTSSCWPSRETFCESGTRREVGDKEN